MEYQREINWFWKVKRDLCFARHKTRWKGACVSKSRRATGLIGGTRSVSRPVCSVVPGPVDGRRSGSTPPPPSGTPVPGKAKSHRPQVVTPYRSSEGTPPPPVEGRLSYPRMSRTTLNTCWAQGPRVGGFLCGSGKVVPGRFNDAASVVKSTLLPVT